MTSRYLTLRACERFGMKPADMDALPPSKVAELLAFEEIRQVEEARERAGRK